GLVCAVVVLGTFMLFVGGNGRAQLVHTCTPTDRQFIDVAQLNMAALGSASEDYLHGSSKADSVIDTAAGSLKNIKGTYPSDRSPPPAGPSSSVWTRRAAPRRTACGTSSTARRAAVRSAPHLAACRTDSRRRQASKKDIPLDIGAYATADNPPRVYAVSVDTV